MPQIRCCVTSARDAQAAIAAFGNDVQPAPQLTWALFGALPILLLKVPVITKSAVVRRLALPSLLL